MNRYMKFTFAFFCLFFLLALLWSESHLSEDFASFGVGSIGIYVESYEDERVPDFVKAYTDAYLNPYKSGPSYTMSSPINDYNGITPKLMTPGYPLGRKAEPVDADLLDDLDLDDGDLETVLNMGVENWIVGEGLASYVAEWGWEQGFIHDFEGGNLFDLRVKAQDDGYDAVLIARYYKVEYWVPSSRNEESGQLKEGLAFVPALELYDCASGVRLWYSAYWTGSPESATEAEKLVQVANFESLFVTGNWPVIEAAVVMADSTLGGAGFPKASQSGERDEKVVVSCLGSSHLFWTDYPEYEEFATILALGYSFSYIGDFTLYTTEYYGPNADTANVVGTAKGAMVHSLNFPYLAWGWKNFAIEPGPGPCWRCG